jgi:hypothetical protein
MALNCVFTSWKAERRRSGALIEVVPVMWTKGWRSEVGGTALLEGRFRTSDEMEGIGPARNRSWWRSASPRTTAYDRPRIRRARHHRLRTFRVSLLDYLVGRRRIRRMPAQA